MVKRYEIEDGVLLAAANDKGLLDGAVTLRWEKPGARAEMLVYGSDETVALDAVVTDGTVTVSLPAAEACVIVIR